MQMSWYKYGGRPGACVQSQVVRCTCASQVLCVHDVGYLPVRKRHLIPVSTDVSANVCFLKQKIGSNNFVYWILCKCGLYLDFTSYLAPYVTTTRTTPML